MSKEVLDAALLYAQRGWKVFPLQGIVDGICCCGNLTCTDKGKHPPKKFLWKREASSDVEQIKQWFTPEDHNNIAIMTGQVSELTVLDIDMSDGKPGVDNWNRLNKEIGEPQTLIAQTGSGGMHFFFKYYSGLKTSSNTIEEGIDCRNDSGYVVAPPSLHRSGKLYSWLVPFETPLASLPAHLSQRRENRGRPRKNDWRKHKYTIEQVAEMLEKIEADDRDLWIRVGIILGREFNRDDKAWEEYVRWSNRWGGPKGRNHDEIMMQAFHETSQQASENQLSLGTIVKLAIEKGWAPKFGEVPVSTFVYYGPGNNFIYRPTVSFWITEAVNAACSPINEGGTILGPADWLRRNVLATSMTKDPLLETDYEEGVDCRDGTLIKQKGAATFNSYRPPIIEPGDPRLAKPFLEHISKVFPHAGDSDQFLDYMAHRVQRPGEKPRFALLIAGDQGVGKDTAVEFCCPAVGYWNVANIEPNDLDSGFNEYASSVLVRVSEAANLHDMNKWAFNERMKVLIAGTPDHVQINPKYGQKYSVRLHCGVIITTNHMISGIYIPADDRRYDVIESASKEEMGLLNDEQSREYFSELWDWFGDEGKNHIATFLLERDLSKFSPANGQRKTEAHKTVVSSNLQTDHWIFDVLEELKEPDLVRSDAIMAVALKDGMHSGKELAGRMQSAMVRAGYNPIRSARKDGRWKIEGKLATVYGRRGMTGTGPEVAERIVKLVSLF